MFPKSARRYAVLTAGVFVLCSEANAAVPADPARQARASLEASAKAYRHAPALTDTLTYVVQAPNSEKEPKTLEIRLGPGRDVAVMDPALQAMAIGGTLYLTKSDAPGRYVSRPYAGDLGKSLNAIVGEQGSLFEPIQIAMRAGKTYEQWIDALRFKLLAPLRVTGFTRKTGEDRRPVDEIRLSADNGEVALEIDAATHFLSSIRMRMRPPGAPETMQIQVVGRFSPKIVKPAGLIAFDPHGKTAVAELADLGTTRIQLGAPAPAIEIERSGGGRVALRDLRGSVVVLDFWATWCAPCWKMLRETQSLAGWAARSGLPIRVFAVDTLEQAATAEKKRKAAEAFFHSQGFKMPLLLDLDEAAFHAFGSPGLPSLAVLAPDGTIFKLHQGFQSNLQQTLEAELRAAAKIPAP